MSGKCFGLTVKAVIENEGQQLLVRRSTSNRSFGGCWEWPGGKVDPGEPFDVALLREVKEETGLEVELTGLVGSFEFEMPKLWVVALCMYADVTGGELSLSEEHDKWAWVDPVMLEDYALPSGHKEFMLSFASAGSRSGKE